MNESPLRVMIVDQEDQRARALGEALHALGYVVVGHACGHDFLPKRVAECQADLVIVHIDAPNRDTLEQIDHVHRKHPLPIVVFTQDDDSDMIARAVRAGVSAYVVDGLQHAKVRSVIDVAIAQFRAFQAIREELQQTQTRLDKTGDTERAKAWLIDQRHMSEEQAHRHLQKLAMDQKRKINQVAAEILRQARGGERTKPSQENK